MNLQYVNHLQAELRLYNQHLFFVRKQRELYLGSIRNCEATSCVIVMDFKENFQVGGGPVETGACFFSKKQVSVLGFAVHYRDEYGNYKIRYFDYLSEILSHDSLFVSEYIAKLLEYPFMLKFNAFAFWSDSGPHFRSAELLHFVCEVLPEKFPRKLFLLNFFGEYHGKNVVDGHFGILSRWFAEGERVRYILNIQDLICWLRRKAGSEVTNINVVFEIYSRQQ